VCKTRWQTWLYRHHHGPAQAIDVWVAEVVEHCLKPA
jgi:hypothetical protein